MVLGFLNIGTQEMVLIVIVILLLFGGKKLPELARGLGRGIREFKDASEGIKQEISDQINNFEKDLDVTVDEPKQETKPVEPEADDKVTSTADEVENAEKVEEKPEDKNSFPQFTTPENTLTHNPGQQPSPDGEHYSYGYNDHFSAEESAVTESTPVAQEPADEEPKKNA